MTYRAILIPGDGIGPEVTAAARRVLDATGVPISWEVVEVGERARSGGDFEPVPADALDRIRQAGVALKGPIATRAGATHRSANLTVRQELDLFVQLRHIRSFAGVDTAFGPVDLVVARETTEDLYAGIEFAGDSADAGELRAWIEARGFRVAPGSGVSVKAISAAAFERALSYMIRWARANDRHRITVVHKATVMKATDAILLQVAHALAAANPDLEIDDCAVDACAMKLVRQPDEFDVIVTINLYGDILSDLAASLVGGVGVVAGANHGDRAAVFEAAHGTAPKYAGKDRADPIAVILSGALMLDHLGEAKAAARVEQAVASTLVAGVHPPDLGPDGLGTAAFTDEVISRIP
jgi:isocitrate dehydrogenase (NAD+)